LGNILKEAKRFDAAMEVFEAGIIQNPLNSGMHMAVGLIHRERGAYEDARTYLRKALYLDPQNATARSNYGEICEKLGDFATAETMLQDAIQRNPDHANAWLNYGVVMHRKKDFQSAIRMYEKAISLDDDKKLPDARSNLGVALRDVDPTLHHDTAVNLFREAIKMDSNHGNAHTNIVAAFMHKQQFSESYPFAQKSVRLNRNCAECHYQLATVAHVLGKLLEAKEHYSQALLINPSHASTIQNFSVLKRDHPALFK
jgi:tetratricopeptide (TPR) repeat protein